MFLSVGELAIYTLIADVDMILIFKTWGIHSFEHNIHTRHFYHLHPAQDPGWPGPVFTITDSICGFSFHTAEHS